MEYRKANRVKTEGDLINAQIQRQKSIFKNLSWQSKQKDRKISVLEKYYVQLQAVIQKEKEEDTELSKRARGNPGRKYVGSVYQSSLLKQLPRSDPNKIVTEGGEEEGGHRYSVPAARMISELQKKVKAKR